MKVVKNEEAGQIRALVWKILAIHREHHKINNLDHQRAWATHVQTLKRTSRANTLKKQRITYNYYLGAPNSRVRTTEHMQAGKGLCDWKCLTGIFSATIQDSSLCSLIEEAVLWLHGPFTWFKWSTPVVPTLKLIGASHLGKK